MKKLISSLGPLISLFIGIIVLLSIQAAAQQIDTVQYSIKPASVSLKSYLGAFKTAEITITNKGQSSQQLALVIEGPIAAITKADNLSVIIQPGTNKTLAFTFLPQEPGEYNGSLRILGSISEKIPLSIKVANATLPTSELLSMQIDPFENRITSGSDFRAIVTFQNLLSGRPIRITSKYFLITQEKDQATKETLIQQEAITVNTTVTVLKVLQTQNLPEGGYIFEVRAAYEDNTFSTRTRFLITQPLLNRKLFGTVKVKYVLMALIAGILLTGGLYYYRIQKLKKRRYVSKLYQDQLPKPGGRALYVGKLAETTKNAYFEIDQLQTHTLVAGSTGGGKTVSAQVFIEEALAHNVSVMVFDPTAQWTGFLRKNTEKKMLALYPVFGMKPSDAKGFNGNVRQLSDPREIINIKKFMRPGEITCFVVNKLEPQAIDTLVANTLRQVFKANLPESKEVKLLVVFDEVHRLLPKFGGSGQGFLQIERAAREFRKWGVGLFLISQVLTDFAGEIKANISTEVQMRTRDQGDLDRIKTKYGDYMLQSLLKSATGTGMVENTTYNRGEPYFISFRPLMHNHAALSDEELENYSKYNTMLDDTEYQIEQLKEEGIDIFDIELELKLAKDKLKVGNFNMVDIYLESLKPRLADEWRKLGKQPKKYEIKLSSDEELKKEYEAALKARKKLEEKTPKTEKTVQEKPQLKPLRLKNGIVVLSTAELEDAMQNMTPEVLSFHVNDGKNDFVDWAAESEPKLAEKLKQAKTAEGITKVLREFNHAGQQK